MTSQSRRRVALVLGGVLAVLIGTSARPQINAQSANTPISFTVAQADQGQAAYLEQCASCHGQYMDDGQFGPPLKGVDFRSRWAGRRADALFTYLSTSMPPERPGSLGDARYAQLAALILQENGTPPGEREFPTDPEALKAMAAPNWPNVQGGGLAPGVTIPPAPRRTNPLDALRPV